jgi:hypothetical protein
MPAVIHLPQSCRKTKVTLLDAEIHQGHAIPVGDSHFSSRLITLPDQSNTLGGLLNMLIQAVDCTKTGFAHINLDAFRVRKGGG